MPTNDLSASDAAPPSIWAAVQAHARAISIVGIAIIVVIAGILFSSVRSFIALVPVVFTWPVSLLILIVYALSSTAATTHLSTILGRFRSVKFFGSEVTFTSEGARQLANTADEAFNQFRIQADREFKRQIHAYALRESLSRVFDSSDEHCGRIRKKEGFRCTVHIEDILFKDTLYQLLDYYPEPDGSAGRRFSVRFGMIGLTWRMARHEGHWNADARTDEDLIRNWGMTRDEALDRSRQKPSYLCVLLRTTKGMPIGVLFMDSKEPNAFGDNDDQIQQLAGQIHARCKSVGFQEGLEHVVSELRRYNTGGIQIHG
jgi:hypothetical protein